MSFRSIVNLILLCTLCLCSVAVFAQDPVPTPAVNPKEEKKEEKSSSNSKDLTKNLTAEQIVETSIAVYAFPGGREKMNQIRKTEAERGKLTMTDQAGKVTTANYQKWITRGEAANKAKIRLDQELPTATYAMVKADDKVFGIFNDAVFQPREDAVSSFQDRLIHSIDSLLWYKENGSTIELAGRDKILGVDFYLIDLTDKNGNKTRFYVSQRSFRVMMLDYQSGGEKHVRKFRDYKYAQGVLVPFRTELRKGDKLIEETSVGTITFGQKVEESLFPSAT